jgi:acetyl esterase/lipase
LNKFPISFFLSTFLLCSTGAVTQGADVKVLRNLPYADTDNPRQTLDLAIPSEPAPKKAGRPLVIWIHGGGWKNGDKRSGHRPDRLPALVETGRFAGASIAYRLSGEAKWPAQIHDCKAAIRWLRGNAEKYGIDPKRIAVWGSSAGGHLVSMLGSSGGVKELEGKLGKHLDQSSRVSAVVNYYGPSALLQMDDFSSKIVHNDPNSPESQLIGSPIQKSKKKTMQASPLHQVSPNDAPHIHFHGTDDPLVPFNQSEIYHKALKKAGVQSVLITSKGGGHNMPRAFTLRFVLPFLDHALYGKGKPISDQTIPLN